MPFTITISHPDSNREQKMLEAIARDGGWNELSNKTKEECGGGYLLQIIDRLVLNNDLSEAEELRNSIIEKSAIISAQSSVEILFETKD